MMLAHVYERSGSFDSHKSSFNDALGGSGHRHHRTVRCLTGIHIEKLDAFHLADTLGNSLNDFGPPAFTEIGHTLNDSVIHFFSNLRA